MDAFRSLYVWQMMYLQMRLYDENFGEKFSSYRRIFAQISMWDTYQTDDQRVFLLYQQDINFSVTSYLAKKTDQYIEKKIFLEYWSHLLKFVRSSKKTWSLIFQSVKCYWNVMKFYKYSQQFLSIFW